MRLYELSEEYKQVESMLDSDDQDTRQAALDTLESLEGDIAEKIDSVACMIKDIKGEAAAIKAEADKLAKRAKSKADTAARLTAYLLDNMQALGKTKVETPRSVVSLRKSPEAVVVPDENKFILWANFDHEEFIRSKLEIDKTAVKQALLNGEKIPGAYIDSKEMVVIK